MSRLVLFLVVLLFIQIWAPCFVMGKDEVIVFSDPEVFKIQEYPEGIASQSAFNGKTDDILHGTLALMVQNYYGSAFYYNNRVEAVDLKDGKILWAHLLDNMVLDVRRIDNLFFVLTPASVYKIDIITGTIVWRFDLAQATFHDLPKENNGQMVKAKDFAGVENFLPSFDLSRERGRLIIYSSPKTLQLIDLAEKEVVKEFAVDIKHDKNEYNFVVFFQDGYLLKNGQMLFRYGEDFQDKIFEFRLRNYATEQPVFVNMPGGGKGIALPGVHHSYLIDEQGQLIGRYDLEDSMVSLTPVGDALLLEHIRGGLYCVDSKLKNKWEWHNPVRDSFLFIILPVRWNRTFDCPPVPFNHKGKELIMITSTGVLYVVDSRGRQVARKTLIEQPSAKRINEYFSVATRMQPVIIGNRVYAIASMVTGEISRSGRQFKVTDYLVTLEMKE